MNTEFMHHKGFFILQHCEVVYIQLAHLDIVSCQHEMSSTRYQLGHTRYELPGALLASIFL